MEPDAPVEPDVPIGLGARARPLSLRPAPKKPVGDNGLQLAVGGTAAGKPPVRRKPQKSIAFIVPIWTPKRSAKGFTRLKSSCFTS